MAWRYNRSVLSERVHLSCPACWWREFFMVPGRGAREVQLYRRGVPGSWKKVAVLAGGFNLRTPVFRHGWWWMFLESARFASCASVVGLLTSFAAGVSTRERRCRGQRPHRRPVGRVTVADGRLPLRRIATRYGRTCRRSGSPPLTPESYAQ
jgi:hypothetical protein